MTVWSAGKRVLYRSSKNIHRYNSRNGGTFLSSRHLSSLPKKLDFPDKYESGRVESGWYEWWKTSGLFKESSISAPDVDNRFTMILPPPNVTGTLHLGHALTVAVQDTLVRWRRMRGFRTLWVPGCDHAGIATQVVVEKQLKSRDPSFDRFSMGREEFLRNVWKWKREKGGRIFDQLEVMGASLDWSRATFTMDPEHSMAVAEAFKRLYDKGLIYRGDFIVHWSCQLRSAISDIEVDHVKLEKKTKVRVPGYEKPVQFGLIFDFAYKMSEDPSQSIVVSTTRPETIMGDVAIAVHPEDDKYKDLIGKTVDHPFFNGRRLPIVADEKVDPNFGTGAVKITPGHDPNDFLIGKRHNLPTLTVLSEDGKMKLGHLEEEDGCALLNDYGVSLEGIPRFTARWRVVKALKDMDLYRGDREHPMSLPVCSRSGDVIEPMIKPQWFLKTASMYKRALEAVNEGRLKLTPGFYRKEWENWLTNDVDWCLSRQLWWGHRVPAWKVLNEKEEILHWICATDSDQAAEKAQAKGIDLTGNVRLEQDEDVLDTWFSSAILPFANFGWPDNNETTSQSGHRHYPLTLMETGYDILFFWVARMVMLGEELTGDLPFQEVLLHSVICDAHGRKMSKSLGNVIDPVHVIEGRSAEQMRDDLLSNTNLPDSEKKKALAGLAKDFPNGIPRCGTDALRLGLLNDEIKIQQVNLDPKVIQSNSHFCNKLWQAVRMFLMYKEQILPNERVSECAAPSQLLALNLALEDSWILHQCAETVKQANQDLESYNFHLAVRAMKNFVKGDLCDIYLEAIKPHLQGSDIQNAQLKLKILHTCLLTSLKLIHPVMPFITEELYQHLKRGSAKTESIMVQRYPQFEEEWQAVVCEEKAGLMQELLDVSAHVRSTKSNLEVSTKSKPDLVICCSSESSWNLCGESESLLLKTLSGCGEVALTQGTDFLNLTGWKKDSLASGCDIYLNLRPHVNQESVLPKLKKKLAKLMTKSAKSGSENNATEGEEPGKNLVRNINYLESLNSD